MSAFRHGNNLGFNVAALGIQIPPEYERDAALEHVLHALLAEPFRLARLNRAAARAMRTGPTREQLNQIVGRAGAVLGPDVVRSRLEALDRNLPAEVAPPLAQVSP